MAGNKIYPDTNTIVCMEDDKLLKQIDYDILHNAAGLEAALFELNEKNYFHTHLHASTHNYGDMLNGLMKSTFELLRKITPLEQIWLVFALYYDIHNMKLVVKERLFGKRFDNLAIDYGSYSMPTIRSAAVRKSDNILGNDILTEGFFLALESTSAYDIDFILDKLYFKALKEMVSRLKSPGLDEFITEKIDLYNIALVFQTLSYGNPEGYFSKAFSGGGTLSLEEWTSYQSAEKQFVIEQFPLWKKYGHIWGYSKNRDLILTDIDVQIDNYLIGRTKACKLMAFGIEPICAYFFNKFMEIKNIRILLVGKASNYSTDEIKKRMRIPYEI